jgi:hypothetical protein
MPVTTRTRTGKLPARATSVLQQQFFDVEESEEVEEGEEVEIVAEEQQPEEVKDSGDGYTNLDESTLVEQTPAPERTPPDRFVFETFTTFKSKSHLRDGLNLIRHLGGGKYEIVNLQHVAHDIMGSEEVGNHLRDNPKRLELFEQAKEGFANSKLNIEQAAHSASKSTSCAFKLSRADALFVSGICASSPPYPQKWYAVMA